MLLPGSVSSYQGILHKAVFLSSKCFNTHLCLIPRGILCFAHAVARRLPGFWFWKARVDQSAVCCGSSPPISCASVPCVGGLLLCFYLSTSVSLSRGAGAELALQAALWQLACRNVYMYIHELDTHQYDWPLICFLCLSLSLLHLLCSKLKMNMFVMFTQPLSKSDIPAITRSLSLCFILCFLSCSQNTFTHLRWWKWQFHQLKGTLTFLISKAVVMLINHDKMLLDVCIFWFVPS